MRICVVFQNGHANGERVPCYPWSYVDALLGMGHEVCMWSGEGLVPFNPDLFLEIENGRNDKGELRFYAPEVCSDAHRAVLLYDTHGHPDLHALIAKKYDYVFFGSWVKRDLFAGHKSAHWCPSATDLRWFGTPQQLDTEPEFDFGFFGSKKGLARAAQLIEICRVNGWSCDVRQVASNRNVNRWPATGDAMAKCRVLFNHGQKHDGPNLRVMESMAMGRPLLCDIDTRSGMDQLFKDAAYWGYIGSVELEHNMRFLMKDAECRKRTADRARREVEANHLVKHRAAQILEVVCNS